MQAKFVVVLLILASSFMQVLGYAGFASLLVFCAGRFGQAAVCELVGLVQAGLGKLQFVSLLSL